MNSISSSGAGRKVWDLPVRLFHVLLIVLVGLLWWTGSVGGLDVNVSVGGKTLFLSNMDLHACLGQGVLGLVIFRVLWGIAGSSTARFSSFVRGPRAVWGEFSALLRGETPHGVGHNPLGALMIIALLLALATQATLGLFTADDIFFEAPLYHLVDDDLASRFLSWHRALFNVILGLVGLHVVAVLYYLVRGRNLIGPMLTGRARVSGSEVRMAPLWLALVMALIAAAVIFWIRSL